MFDIPDKCVECPTLRHYKVRVEMLEARLEEYRGLAKIVMQDTTDQQKENWAKLGSDTSDEGVAASEQRRRQDIAAAMDRVDPQIAEEDEIANKYTSLCAAGVIRLKFDRDNKKYELTICGSARVTSSFPGELEMGYAEADIKQLAPEE